jgi:hypothetical protein
VSIKNEFVATSEDSRNKHLRPEIDVIALGTRQLPHIAKVPFCVRAARDSEKPIIAFGLSLFLLLDLQDANNFAHQH